MDFVGSCEGFRIAGPGFGARGAARRGAGPASENLHICVDIAMSVISSAIHNTGHYHVAVLESAPRCLRTCLADERNA